MWLAREQDVVGLGVGAGGAAVAAFHRVTSADPLVGAGLVGAHGEIVAPPVQAAVGAGVAGTPQVVAGTGADAGGPGAVHCRAGVVVHAAGTATPGELAADLAQRVGSQRHELYCAPCAPLIAGADVGLGRLVEPDDAGVGEGVG